LDDSACGVQDRSVANNLTKDELVPRLEHYQQVLRSAFERMHRQRHTELDESFWQAMRQSLVAAGATDSEIDSVAAYMVTVIVEATDVRGKDPESASVLRNERRQQLS
jgi:hypothetical protein